MARIFLLIILGYLLYQVLKRMAASANSKPNAKSEENLEEKPEERIVQCANCGCHVPISESQIKNNKILCNNPECQQNQSTKK